MLSSDFDNHKSSISIFGLPVLQRLQLIFLDNDTQELDQLPTFVL